MLISSHPHWDISKITYLSLSLVCRKSPCNKNDLNVLKIYHCYVMSWPVWCHYTCFWLCTITCRSVKQYMEEHTHFIYCNIFLLTVILFKWSYMSNVNITIMFWHIHCFNWNKTYYFYLVCFVHVSDWSNLQSLTALVTILGLSNVGMWNIL